MTFKVITPPTVEPVSLDLARRHCRITPDEDSPPFHPDDAWITEIGIPAARTYCEQFLMRSLAPQTVETILDEFPANEIQLVGSPIAQIIYITYIDEDGNYQVLPASEYVLDNEQEPGWVLPVLDTTWPTTYGVINAVRVRYEAGYTSPYDIQNNMPMPAAIKAAILMMVGHLYENREATNMLFGSAGVQELPLGVQALLIPYQLRMSMA